MRWLASALLVTGIPASAIDIRLYSEHSRSREVLSPAVVRNTHASFRVVVAAPPGTLYFLAIQTNPAAVFRINLYREPLIEERNIGFLAGVTPAAKSSSAETETVYLLDLWVPPETRQYTVRVEALVKTAYWKVAPMEVRVLPVAAPALPACVGPYDRSIPPVEVLLAALMGDPPHCAPLLTRLDSVIARNSAEDGALANILPPSSRENVFRALLASLLERQWSFIAPQPGESYMRLRQLLYREAGRSATGPAIGETRKLAPGSR
jgi:hypothetical protein